jgi:dTMP kinase
MFVVFEGLDGSGKSTLMRAFKEYLEDKKQGFKEVFDPGCTSIGDKVREVLLSKEDKPTSQAELLLYQASRAELVYKVIKPSLEAGSWVVSDRFFQSTLAFQGYARGLSLENIHWLNNFATGGLSPDVVVWINTPVEVCAERLQKRKNEGGELSRLDEEKKAFHQKVFEGYKALSEDKNTNTAWIVLDGLKTPEELTKELIKKFEALNF